MSQGFLPICKKDMEERGWEQLDFVYISGEPSIIWTGSYYKASGRLWIQGRNHRTAGLER